MNRLDIKCENCGETYVSEFSFYDSVSDLVSDDYCQESVSDIVSGPVAWCHSCNHVNVNDFETINGDVETHDLGHYSREYPAVNVKVYHYPDIYDVVDRFDCTEEIAEQALLYALESTQEWFWSETINDLETRFFDRFTKLHSAGRSSGWLVAETEIENADDLRNWLEFEKAVKAEVDFITSLDYVLEHIESNRWAEEGAREYNFIDKLDGSTACLADL